MRRKLKRLERKKKKEDRKRFFHISFYLNPDMHPDAEIIKELREKRYNEKRASDMAKAAFLSFATGFIVQQQRPEQRLPDEKEEKGVPLSPDAFSNLAEE